MAVCHPERSKQDLNFRTAGFGLCRDLPRGILWDSGDPWRTKGLREALQNKGNLQTSVQKAEHACGRPAGLSRKFLPGLEYKAGEHGGVNRDVRGMVCPARTAPWCPSMQAWN